MRLLDAVLVWAHRVLAVVVLVVAINVIVNGGPAGSRDPQGSQGDGFLGVIQSFTIAPGLGVSLLVNSFVLGRHGVRGWSVAERVLVLVQFATIAFLQVCVLVVAPPGTFGLRLLAWIAVIVLAAMIFVRAAARNRDASLVAPS